MHFFLFTFYIEKFNTCPIITSETSAPFNPTFARLSLITILPSIDAFREDRDPQNDPVTYNLSIKKYIDCIFMTLYDYIFLKCTNKIYLFFLCGTIYCLLNRLYFKISFFRKILLRIVYIM